MVQGFSNSSWLGQILGYGRTQDDQLQLSTVNGFNLELMTGAQLHGEPGQQPGLQLHRQGGFEVATPNLLINFTQPLLRGAWARIVTQQPVAPGTRRALRALRVRPLPPYVLRWPGRRERLSRDF